MTENQAFYRFQKYYIPARMGPGITRYVERGIIPGDFLQAVIQNNLQNACGRADDENMANLPAYVGYFYNEAPADCWGSVGAMEKWSELKKRFAELKRSKG